MINDKLYKALAATGIGFGTAAVLAPRPLLRAYGGINDGTVIGATQLYGTRTAALGLFAAATSDPVTRQNLTKLVAGLCAVDTILSVISGVRGVATPRTAAQTAASTAAVGALAIAALRG